MITHFEVQDQVLVYYCPHCGFEFNDPVEEVKRDALKKVSYTCPDCDGLIEFITPEIETIHYVR